MDAQQTELMSALSALYDAGKYSDLTVKCQQRRFQVHRAILCSRSGFFDAAASNPFLEAQSGEIDLSEDDEQAVEHVIHYFYHLDYLCPKRKTRPSPFYRRRRADTNRSNRSTSSRSKALVIEDPLVAQATASTSSNSHYGLPTPPEELPVTLGKRAPSPEAYRDTSVDWDSESESASDDESFVEDTSSDEPQLLVNAKVYSIAEKYGIGALKRLAKDKFEAQCARHWESAEFPDALFEVYEGTPDEDRGLRGIVVQCFREHPELARIKDVQLTIKDLAPLAWDLYRVATGMPL